MEVAKARFVPWVCGGRSKAHGTKTCRGLLPFHMLVPGGEASLQAVSKRREMKHSAKVARGTAKVEVCEFIFYSLIAFKSFEISMRLVD